MKTQAYAMPAREPGPAQRIDRRIKLDPLPARRVESGRRVAGTIIGLIGGLMFLGVTGILFGEQVIHPAQINGVQIGAPKGQQGGTALHILTDDGRVYFGAGLSRPAQEWLRNCLLAAVARL